MDTADPNAGLRFVALGGSDEIGMNLYLYEVDGQWLMVDCGVAFGDETTPGVDVLMPSVDFIADKCDRLVGLVLTHGHEDHFGAIQYLWPRLRCPVYATPFTAAFLRLKLRDAVFDETVPVREVPLGGRVSLGPFDVTFVEMTHSIPEPNALIIRTKYGNVVHSGDWKRDPKPPIGRTVDEDTLRQVGAEGVLALVSDSTNALEDGHSGSESDARDALVDVIARQPNRVAVTCFSTNVGRILGIAEAAAAADRQCALIGRSLWRVHEAATATGYMTPPAPFLTESEAAYLPRDRVVLICTGSQGESRAALSRIAADTHPHVVLEPGDTVIFSAREIPGNEKAIARVQNALTRQGVRVITPAEAPVHVSGHPARDELTALYQWVRPEIVIPVHGDARRQRAQAALARACQVPQTLVPEDGVMFQLAPGPAGVVDHVPVGRIARDGERLVHLNDGIMKQRHRLTHNGVVTATLVLDDSGRLLADPQIAAFGLYESNAQEAAARDLAEDVRDRVEDLPRPRRRDDEAVRTAAIQALRRRLRSELGKKPLMEIKVLRLGD